MAIYIKNGDGSNDLNQLQDAIEGLECFLCGGHLFEDDEHSTGGVVFWQGSSGFIAFHQPCAERFGVNLIQDARSLASKVKRIAKLNHDHPTNADYLWYTK